MIRPAQVLTLIVAGVAVAAAGLWLASRYDRGEGAQDAQGPVLALRQSDLNGVTRLRIFKGDGSHTTLQRQDAQWLVTERGFPADTGQVRKLLLDLAALQIEEQKTADPALYSKLGVENPSAFQATSTGVDIDLNGKTLSLIVGHPYGTGSVYVRVAGQARSALATPQLAPDADPRHWLDRTLLDITPDQVAQVQVTPQGAPAYTLKHAAANATPEYVIAPIPKGREAGDAAAPASEVGALAGLQLDDVRKVGSAAAVAHATFTTRDGLQLLISGIQEAEQRYITVVASASSPSAQTQAHDLNARLSGWEFQIPGYRYEALFHPLEQLLKPLPVAPPAGKGKPGQGPAPVHPKLPFGPPAGTAGQDTVTPQQSH